MYCGKCGAQLNDDWKKCPYCGEVIVEENKSPNWNENINWNNTYQNSGTVPPPTYVPKKKKRRKPIIYVGIIVIGIVVIGGIGSAFTKANSVTVGISQDLIDKYGKTVTANQNDNGNSSVVETEKETEKETEEIASDSQIEETENNVAKNWETEELLDYANNMTSFVNKYPSYIMQHEAREYGDMNGNIDIIFDKNDVLQCALFSEIDEMPYIGKLKVGMSTEESRKKIDSAYDLVESDSGGDAFYCSNTNSYIVTYKDEDSAKVTAVVYMTQAYMDQFSDTSGNTSNSSEYILPDSNSRYLSDSEVSRLSQDEIQMAINEIYARHGCIFNTDSIQAYFESKSWYYGTISINNFDSSQLNDYERKNMDLLIKYRG